MLNLEQIRLVDILPQNLRTDKKVLAAATAFDQELAKLTRVIPTLNLLYTIDQQSEVIVDELAWAFHVDFYDKNLPIEKKRELVKKSISWHRIKGTPEAVEQVITAAFDECRVEEWFQYGGKPYHFKIITKDRIPDKTTLKALVRAIESVKNTRSWLESISFQRDEDLGIYHSQVITITKIIDIGSAKNGPI
ncbi:phage tail protein I [Brevibacillus laterosporus]|uniref:phage tail protein I n=1 Tax=Brevibacillus laterosporus TaxID=1465 RepID=UPI003D1AE3FE